jgi:predicted O-methyltransferase YrrM
MDQMRMINRLTRTWNVLLRRPEANYPRWVAVSEANSKTMDFIKDKRCRMIAELGVYQGHTSMAFAKYLNGEGSLHLYDFHDRVRTVAAKLEHAGFQNVQFFACSYRYRDSYNWALGKAIATHGESIYDYIFLDGAHDWAIDALAALLSDRLLKVGGYLDFDDYTWTLAESPSLNPQVFPLTAKLYTQEQIETQQVKMVVDVLIKRDPRYREVVKDKIFQKIA